MNGPLQTFTNGIKAVGIFFILAGIGTFAIALFVPHLIGLIMAILLMVGGAVRLIFALLSRSEVGFWLKFATGVLYGVAGLILLTGIFHQYLSVSSVLGMVLILEGLLELALALKLQPSSSRRWLYISSGVAFCLGLLFTVQLGVGTVWLLGLLAGLTLITPGAWFLILARAMGTNAAAEMRRKPGQWR
jgi:uncharacterized membrane protein HdeD (DUF308 family)